MSCTRRVSASICIFLAVLLFPLGGPYAGKAPHPQAGQVRKAATPVALVDAAGRKVVLGDLPARIVVVGRGPFMALHLLYMFPEAGRTIVGMEERAKSMAFLPYIDPAFSEKTILKPLPGPEQIASLKPDLVIMKGSAREQVCESLERLGIPVVFLGLETPQQFLRDVDNVGIVFGNRARAEAIKAYYRGRLALIRNRVGDIPEEKKPGLLLLMYTSRGNKAAVQVPAQSWMQTLEVRTAGARPVWADTVSKVSDGWTIVNFEQIALWNPEVICVIVPHSLNPAALIANLKSDPQWRLLRAVKSGRIHAFPSDIFGWDTPEPRWILGMIWTAKTTWPERFRDIGMKQEVVRFFTTLYAMEPSRVEKEIFPKCSMPYGE